MNNDTKNFREGKKRFKKKSDSSAKKERPFEKFRTKDNRKKRRTVKEKPTFERSGKKYLENKNRNVREERPFEKTSEEKPIRSNFHKRDDPSSLKREKQPFKKWEKPSVFFKKKREESDNRNSKTNEHDSGLIRLNKYVANAGICSRREADKMIENGLVEVNGKIVTQLGTKIKREDVVKYNGETLRSERNVYILLNKPKDYIATVKDTHERKTVMELVSNACKERIYPVGRLDRNTTGVLLLTNDGDLTKKLTHPKYGAKKIYHVETDKNVSHLDLKKLTEGVTLEEDGLMKADEANYAGEHLEKNQIGVVLHSGKNRVVRRMFEALGYQVTKLDRVYFAGLTKKDLPRGRWRFLSEKEVGFLKMIK